jgi:hypothetical protein
MNLFIKTVVVLLVVATCLHAAVQLAPKNNNDSKCDLCTFLVGTIESYLAANGTAQQLEVYLNKLCFVLPDLLQAQCVMLVAQLPDIIKQLAEQEPPKVVCQQIKMCNSSMDGCKGLASRMKQLN